MLNYALGASHMALLLFVLYLAFPGTTRLLAPPVKPYSVHYTPDCYLNFPDEVEIEAIRLTVDDVIDITYESPMP